MHAAYSQHVVQSSIIHIPEATVPIWMLRWKAIADGRGRKHVAIFMPNRAHATSDPLSSNDCLGTLYQAQGSPFTGFALEIRRNWNTATEKRLEEKFEIGTVSQEHMWEPDTPELVEFDNRRRSVVDGCALMARVPDATKRAWIADEIMDCQDWLISFVEQLVRKHILSEESLATIQKIAEPKVALMADPGSRASQNVGSAPITQSTMRSLWQAPQAPDTDAEHKGDDI